MKKRITAVFVFSVLAVGTVTAVTVVLGTDAITVAVLVFTIVAATAASLGAWFAWKTGLDLRTLTELTQTSLEERRARKPDPKVRFLLVDTSKGADIVGFTRPRPRRAFQRDQIVDAEYRRLLGSVPAPETLNPLASVLFGSGLSQHDIDRFKDELDHYNEKLGNWLLELEQYRDEAVLHLALRFRFENAGRVPAEGLQVQIQVPRGMKAVEKLPEFPKPPKTPTLRTRSDLLDSLGHRPLIRYPDLADIGPLLGNVRGPHIERGSVTFHVGKILHGVPEDADGDLYVRTEEDGEYRLPWVIHAENLDGPTRGELILKLASAAEEGPAITTLDDLRAKPEDTEEH